MHGINKLPLPEIFRSPVIDTIQSLITPGGIIFWGEGNNFSPVN
jgi:hypothetical protein